MQTRLLCWAALWLTVLVTMPASAQQQQQQGMALQPGAGRAGVGFYTPGEWGLIGSAVVNHADAPRTVLLTLSSRSSDNVQFARQVWVPAQSRRLVLTPIVFARMPSDGRAGVEIEAGLIDNRGGHETLIVDRPQIGAVNIRGTGFETAVMGGIDDATVEVSSALRDAAALPPTTAYVSDDAAPPTPAAWGAVDVLVISRESPQLDPAQMEAIRRWLVGGGRLWINLERVDPDFARRLLPNDWNVTVLDRVEMTDFRIEGGDEPRASTDDPRRVRVDYPYQMVRVAAPDMQTIHHVNGYPASLRKAVGHGELLVTTLEAPAWLEEEGKAGDALKDLQWLLRRERFMAAETPQVGVLDAMAQQQIGYTVLSREPVLVVLGLFTLALLGGGLMLAQRGRLASLGWVAPGLAVVTAAVILGLGLARQTQDPLTLASAQLVEVAADQPYARVESLVSIYTPPLQGGGDAAALGGTGEVAWPDLSTQGGRTVRLLWRDARTWTFPNLELREGSVQTAARTTVAPLASPVTAAVRFAEGGLVGRVDAAALGAIDDAVIVTPAGKLPTKLNADGTFTAPATDALAKDQFFTAGMLGQRQIARQEVYRLLVDRPGFPNRPMLLGWTDGLDLGVTLSDQAQRRAAALVAIPLTFQSPAVGERVTVPAAFMTMSPFKDPSRGYSGAPVYDERNGGWVYPIQQAQTALMAFTLPESLRNVNVDTATVRFTLDAPGRPVALVVYDQGQVREVETWQGPTGTQTVQLAADEAPAINDDGAVVVGLRIGELDDPASTQSWSLMHLEVGVSGTVADQ